MQRFTRSGHRDGDGFTLIEVSVVVVIIGVLVAVAIITLLGSQNRAHDAAAKTLATQGTKSQKVFYSDRATYTLEPDKLEAIEPTVDFEQFDSMGAVVLGKVYVKDEGGGVVSMVTQSTSGKCYWTRESNFVTTYAVKDCDDGIPELAEFQRRPW